MEDDQQFCLRWNNHQSTLISVFDTLLENGTLVDCTLAAEGKFLKAHKVVLSACSPYFATLLTQQYDKHPVFILKDVKFQELRAMMDYMYRGEVNISQDQLAALLRAAESLQIKGLSDNRGSGGGGGGGGNDSNNAKSSESAQKPIPVPVVSKPGLTIEQKRPNKHPAIDADICESREGSTSPTSRKRKKVRRRSTDANNLVDNHDQLSNSSSQSMPHHQQNKQQTSVAPLPQIASATSAANVLNVTKKTDIHEPKKEMDQSMHHHQQQEVSDEDEDEGSIEPPVRRTKQQQQQQHDADLAHMKDKMDSELLIEPKSEYDDGNDETVEDLTLDEEELLEDLDQAGPSHGGEGSSQGYAQWQVDRSQDEVFLAAQEAAGQHRDAQDSSKLPIDDTLLDSEDIIISRRGNSFVLTNVPKSKPTAVKRNGTGLTVKKLGKDCGLYSLKDVSIEKASDRKSIKVDNKPQVTMVRKTIGGSGGGIKVAMPEMRRYTTLNQLPLARVDIIKPVTTATVATLKTVTSQPAVIESNEAIEEYMEFADISNIDNINDDLNMDGLLEKNEFQILTKSSSIEEKYSIVDMGIKSEDLTGADGGDGSSGSGGRGRIRKSNLSMADRDESNSSFHLEMASESSQMHSGDEEKGFACRHCGKLYRWKSTLRRHESVECGGKAPMYSCPYCEYKAKQRGNLGVHVRKHHPDLPALPGKRKKRTTMY